MKITKVTYQKAFVIGPYLQEKVGFEAEIDGTCESEKDVLSALKKTSEEWHIENNPQVHQQLASQAPPTELPIINKAEERIQITLENVSNCTTLQQLTHFYSHNACDRIQTAWHAKREELIQNQNNNNVS